MEQGQGFEEAIEPKNGWGKNLDWMVWLDADAIVLDMVQIEKVTAAYPDAHPYVCRACRLKYSCE